MKKWEKIYIGIAGGLAFITLVGTGLLMWYGKKKGIAYFESMRILLMSIALLLLVAMPVYFVIVSILSMKKGIHNIKKCDDELFSCIDEYKEGWEKENNYYLKQIQIINLYYSNAKVEDLVKNKELGRLLARMDFLSTRNSAWKDLMGSLCSLGISVIASFILQIIEVENFFIGCLSFLTILFSFFLVTLMRYSDRGQAGSYRYLIDQYEIELLSEKIEEVTNHIHISDEDEMLLKTKQNVLGALFKIKKKTRKKKLKEQIKQDIILLEKLDLCLGEYTGCYKQDVYIDGSLCYLVYDEEKGKENNYMGKFNFKTRDYAILYDILERNKLIEYMP